MSIEAMSTRTIENAIQEHRETISDLEKQKSKLPFGRRRALLNAQIFSRQHGVKKLETELSTRKKNKAA